MIIRDMVSKEMRTEIDDRVVNIIGAAVVRPNVSPSPTPASITRS